MKYNVEKLKENYESFVCPAQCSGYGYTITYDSDPNLEHQECLNIGINIYNKLILDVSHLFSDKQIFLFKLLKHCGAPNAVMKHYGIWGMLKKKGCIFSNVTQEKYYTNNSDSFLLALAELNQEELLKCLFYDENIIVFLNRDRAYKLLQKNFSSEKDLKQEILDNAGIIVDYNNTPEHQTIYFCALDERILNKLKFLSNDEK